MSACSGHPRESSLQEAAQYAARARHNYTPPGPPSDPWGPYIVEASAKYDVPERWVRGVMRQESSGRLYENGQLITSDAGAMGLMQVMPETFDELRARYGLGDDPYDPHDNIMAGTAYIRELYDMYGSPGFLAAYNAGPGRFQDYLTNNRPLPDETRNYVAKIGPYIQDSYPQRLSPATQYAMNQIPINIPAGPRYPHTRAGQPVALAENRYGRQYYPTYSPGPVQTAALPEPPRLVPPPPVPQVQYASAAQQPSRLGESRPTQSRGGFHFIPQAVAETVPLHRGATLGGAAGGSRGWAIQVGAFASESMAHSAAEAAKAQVWDVLATGRTYLGTVRQGGATLYRARLGDLSREAAAEACERLSRKRGACIIISPDSAS